MLPGHGVGQVHQGLGVQEAEPKTAVDHEPGSVPLPPGVAGQGVKLRGPNHNVLQVPPREIWAGGAERRQLGLTHWAPRAVMACWDLYVLLLQGQGKYSSGQRGGGGRARVSLGALVVQIGTRLGGLGEGGGRRNNEFQHSQP